MANKVQFGLKNVHYAVLTESLSAAPSWGTPVAVPGAVNINLDPETAENIFYADNQAYYRSAVSNGYTGSLEMARIPESMLSAIWGYGDDATAHVTFESADAQQKPFALLFQFEGDQEEELYCFYKCYASRPNVSSQTTGDGGIEPQTQTLDLTIMPVQDPTSGVMDKKVSVRTNASTTTTVRSGWFSSVFTGYA